MDRSSLSSLSSDDPSLLPYDRTELARRMLTMGAVSAFAPNAVAPPGAGVGAEDIVGGRHAMRNNAWQFTGQGLMYPPSAADCAAPGIINTVHHNSEDNNTSSTLTNSLIPSLSDLFTLDLRPCAKLEDAIIEVKMFLERVRLSVATEGLGVVDGRCVVTIITGEDGDGSSTAGKTKRQVIQSIFRKRRIDFVDNGGELFCADALSGIGAGQTVPVEGHNLVDSPDVTGLVQHGQMNLGGVPNMPHHNHLGDDLPLPIFNPADAQLYSQYDPVTHAALMAQGIGAAGGIAINHPSLLHGLAPPNAAVPPSIGPSPPRMLSGPPNSSLTPRFLQGNSLSEEMRHRSVVPPATSYGMPQIAGQFNPQDLLRGQLLASNAAALGLNHQLPLIDPELLASNADALGLNHQLPLIDPEEAAVRQCLLSGRDNLAHSAGPSAQPPAVIPTQMLGLENMQHAMLNQHVMVNRDPHGQRSSRLDGPTLDDNMAPPRQSAIEESEMPRRPGATLVLNEYDHALELARHHSAQSEVQRLREVQRCEEKEEQMVKDAIEHSAKEEESAQRGEEGVIQSVIGKSLAEKALDEKRAKQELENVIQKSIDDNLSPSRQKEEDELEEVIRESNDDRLRVEKEKEELEEVICKSIDDNLHPALKKEEEEFKAVIRKSVHESIPPSRKMEEELLEEVLKRSAEDPVPINEEQMLEELEAVIRKSVDESVSPTYKKEEELLEEVLKRSAEDLVPVDEEQMLEEVKRNSIKYEEERQNSAPDELPRPLLEQAIQLSLEEMEREQQEEDEMRRAMERSVIC